MIVIPDGKLLDGKNIYIPRYTEIIFYPRLPDSVSVEVIELVGEGMNELPEDYDYLRRNISIDSIVPQGEFKEFLNSPQVLISDTRIYFGTEISGDVGPNTINITRDKESLLTSPYNISIIKDDVDALSTNEYEDINIVNILKLIKLIENVTNGINSDAKVFLTYRDRAHNNQCFKDTLLFLYVFNTILNNNETLGNKCVCFASDCLDIVQKLIKSKKYNNNKKIFDALLNIGSTLISLIGFYSVKTDTIQHYAETIHKALFVLKSVSINSSYKNKTFNKNILKALKQ